MNIENILNEELKKIKLLYNYDTSKTLNENEIILTEQSLKSLMTTNKSVGQALTKDIRNVTARINRVYGGLKDINGKSLKSSSDIFNAFKQGRLVGSELGRFNWSVFRETSNKEIVNVLSKDIVKTKNFGNKYGVRKFDDGVNALVKDYNITRDKAKVLMTDYKSLGKPKPNLKVPPNPISRKKTPNLSYRRNNIKNPSKVDNLIKNNSNKIKGLMKNNKKGLIDWLKKTKLVKGVKSVIRLRTIWKLIKWTGIAWLVWALFFRDNGITIESDCPEGFEIDPNTGLCVDKSGEEINPDDLDGEDDEDVVEDDSEIFTECEGTYKLGCTDSEGIINKAQRCLGVNPTGNFDKETENALYKKINKVQFTKDDIEDICLSIGGVSYRL
jgi:hypothetical protein